MSIEQSLRKTESMTVEQIVEYISGTLRHVDVTRTSMENSPPEDAWGDVFFFYSPAGDGPADHRFPFATLVVHDYAGFDEASDLNRPGVFRLNIGITKGTFHSIFPPSKADEREPDFSVLDKIMPHPVYGKMYWVCVLNPGPKTFNQLKPLIQEAWDIGARRHNKQ
jgi:Family of unknown function (DUF6194)